MPLRDRLRDGGTHPGEERTSPERSPVADGGVQWQPLGDNQLAPSYPAPAANPLNARPPGYLPRFSGCTGFLLDTCILHCPSRSMAQGNSTGPVVSPVEDEDAATALLGAEDADGATSSSRRVRPKRETRLTSALPGRSNGRSAVWAWCRAEPLPAGAVSLFTTTSSF
jgi:hypothetical protein